MSRQDLSFQAEVKEILNLMVHSLYSQKEIFLRELISNASDALDKLRFESLTHPEWKLSAGERGITITPDANARTIKIEDNGIGMSYDEVIQNIGTIARSGTREFLKSKTDMSDKPELIGQFGVGFYSAFIVGEKVVLHTQRAGETDGTLWESAGDGQYQISKVPRAEGHGTTVLIHLKQFSDEENAQDFCDEWTLKSIVKKYSDFISFPIQLRTTKKGEGDTPETETVTEKMNSQKALWLRSSHEIQPEEYKEFYHHIAHDWSEPLRTIHYKAEGTQEFTALMFLPKTLPFDYRQHGGKYGLNLYVKRVFILANCEDLQPHYLRFVKGIVDSSDLSLNVSREILQNDAQVQKIQKAVVAKILNSLREMLNKERKDYEAFWQNFGESLKEGFVTDPANKEKLQDLLIFKSSKGPEWTSLEEYRARMPEAQKAIYYLSADSLEGLQNSPYLEQLNRKGFEVLFLTDTIDEWVAREFTEFKGKAFVSVASEDLDLGGEDQTVQAEDKAKIEERFGELKRFIEQTLKEQIKEVRVSSRLVDSPVCLVTNSFDPSSRMERLMESMGKGTPKAKRILEINPKHPVFEKIFSLGEKHKADWIEILYTQALLAEGSPIQDPARFGRQIADLMCNSN